MYLQPLKYSRTDTEQHNCHNPEIHRREEILKEPFPLADCASVTVDNVNQWIQLQNKHPFGVQTVNIPQDRCSPHAYLQRNIDNLGQIPEKYHDRAGRVAQCQHKYEKAGAVINDLYRIDRPIISINSGNHQKNAHKKYMDEGCCDDLDDRQDTDLKYNLFDKVIVFQHGICAVV